MAYELTDKRGFNRAESWRRRAMRSIDGLQVEVCDYIATTDTVLKFGGVLHVSREWWNTIKDGTDEQRRTLLQAKVIDLDGEGWTIGGRGSSITLHDGV